MKIAKIKEQMAVLDARLEDMHRRRPYVLWSIALLVTLYFGIALYGNARAWYTAREQLFRAFDEVETIRINGVNDSIDLDSIVQVVTDSGYHRDTVVIRRITEVLYRLETKQSAIQRLYPQMDSLYVYLKQNAPIWEQLRGLEWRR